MNQKPLHAIQSFEHSEALLQEYENKIVILGYVKLHAKMEGWSESHTRMAQLVALAEWYTNLQLENERLAMMQPPPPIILERPHHAAP